MKIISHRGLWTLKSNQNSLQAFKNSLSKGFGIETDIRDYHGELVISHDIANEESIPLDFLFKLYSELNCSLPLALNIKSDGLQDKLNLMIERYDIKNYFLFDMAFPDHKQYIDKKFRTFMRLSEYESDLSLYNQTLGIWLDAFDKIWYNKKLIMRHSNCNKQICIVSEELHRRDYIDHWNFLLKERIHILDNVTLCTDFPELANNFFNNEK